jgi:HlyD family secretion protein
MMKKRTLVITALAIVAVGLLLAWAFAPRPVQVEVAEARRGLFERSIEEDARTRLRDRYVVSAPLAGQLARIPLREGDAVRAGDVLATLTPVYSPMLDERTVSELNARIDTIQAMVQRAGARVERAQVAVELARQELARSEQLAQQGFIAATKRDTDRLALDAARKEYDTAVLDQRVARHELTQARAALSAVRAPGTGAARAFQVRAPVDAQVLKLSQTSEGVVALGSALMELGDTRQLEVVAELLTHEALQTPPGTPVRIDRWGGPVSLDGRVRRVEPAAFTKVSALGVEEQRVRVIIDIDTPHAQWSALGDGYRVGVQLIVRREPDALRVPVSAVFPWDDGGRGGMAVFLVREGRARVQPVVVGERNGMEAWIREGLDEGATVIVYPPAAVKDGVRVQVRHP